MIRMASPCLEILLLVNRVSGVGAGAALAQQLLGDARRILGSAGPITLREVDDHPAATAMVREALDRISGPLLVVAAGGGGTLQAVLQAIGENAADGVLPGPQRLRIAPLRMGSGNVLARRLGVRANAHDALRQIAHALSENQTIPCCVGRYDFDQAGGRKAVRFAATLAGFGQLGRIPADLARWHERRRRLHLLLARWCRLERLTSIEYAADLVARMLWCGVHPSSMETIEVRNGDRVSTLRLLMGAVLNFPVKALPFDAMTDIRDPRLSLHLTPAMGVGGALAALVNRPSIRRVTHTCMIDEHRAVEIVLKDRACAGFFLDEDPMEFCGRLTIRVAGVVHCIGGGE